MQLDFIDAAKAALASYLQTALNAHASIADGAIPVQVDWPDFGAAAPSQIAYVIVTSSNPTLSPRVPSQHAFEGGTATYAIGRWDATLQVDVAARYKDAAQDLGTIVRQALSDVPFDAGRTITCDGYYDAKVRLSPSEGDRDWGAEASFAGMFRRTIEAAWGGPLLATRAWPTYEQVVLAVNTRSQTVTLE